MLSFSQNMLELCLPMTVFPWSSRRFRDTDKDENESVLSSILIVNDLLYMVSRRAKDLNSTFSLVRGFDETIIRSVCTIYYLTIAHTIPVHRVGRVTTCREPHCLRAGLFEKLDCDEDGTTIVTAVLMQPSGSPYYCSTPDPSSRIAFTTSKILDFVSPPPGRRNVDTMPFVMGDKSALPKDMQIY